MPTMWDRLRTHKDGTPTSHSDRRTVQSQQQDEWENPRSSSPYGYSISIKGGPAPPRPPREYLAKTSPSDHLQTTAPAVQPPRYPPQAGRDSYRNSDHARPASSIYSQPSPAAATFAAQQLRDEVYGNSQDISPPSSPDDVAPRNVPHSYGGDVSPIEETENHLFIMNQPSTTVTAEPNHGSIPNMRRERRKNSTSAFQAARDGKPQERPRQPRPHGSDVRWDPRTGEPTAGEKGRPSQIDPHQFVQRLANAQAPTGAPRATGQQPISPFGIRLKPATNRSAVNNPKPAPKAEPAPRPEWRGGSGRTALVQPVADNQDAAPLRIPPRSNKRTARDRAMLSPVSSVGSDAASSPPVPVAPIKFDDRKTQPATTRSITPPSQQIPPRTDSQTNARSYPSPPLSNDYTALAKTPQPVPSQQQAQALPNQTPKLQNLAVTNDKAIRRKPAGGAGNDPRKSTASSVYSHRETPQAPPVPVDEWVQPPSRFSVTTYATSAYTESPRPSIDEAPPMPTPPRQFTESPQPATGSSILDRRRPVVSGYEGSIRSLTSPEPIKINMDSPYYTAVAEPKSRPSGPRPVPGGGYSNVSVTTVSSVDKSLPLAPPEQSARDRVTMLNAQIGALGNRRININQAIKQMTELMPTDNVLASDAVVRKRELEKRKVDMLKQELADVQREEYELGLKLHRAYKRMDREAEYEPTTLWVRRVTG